MYIERENTIILNIFPGDNVTLKYIVPFQMSFSVGHSRIGGGRWAERKKKKSSII